MGVSLLQQLLLQMWRWTSLITDRSIFSGLCKWYPEFVLNNRKFIHTMHHMMWFLIEYMVLKILRHKILHPLWHS
jgi:hypothetical protein